MFESDFDEEDELLPDEESREDGQDLLEQFDDYKRKLEDYKNPESKGKELKDSEGSAKGAPKGGAKAAEKTAAKDAGEKTAGKAATKRLGAKIAADVLAGAATDGLGLVLLIPDLYKYAKSKSTYIFYGCVGCCLFPFAFGLLILMVMLGAGGWAGTMGNMNNTCPARGLDDWSVTTLFEDKGYVPALKYAEQETFVPWELIAAVDYRDYVMGQRDDNRPAEVCHTTALVELGNQIQEANLMRDSSGKPVLDEDGKTIKTITPDINDLENKNMPAVISILTNYRCKYGFLNILNRKLKDPTKPEFASFPFNTVEEIDDFCFNKNPKGPDGKSTNTAEAASHDAWISGEFQNEGNDIANEIKQKLRSLEVAGPYLGWAGDKLNWVGSAVLDIPGWFGRIGAAPLPEIGAATWYKVFTMSAQECDQCKEAGCNLNACGLAVKFNKEKTPDGGSPVCTDPNLTKPGDKALCAAQKVVELGTPYEMGGPTTCYGNWAACPAIESIPNFDCSGLAGWAWYQAGVDIGGNGAASQYARISNHPSMESLEPGDLIFFGESYSCENIINGKCSQHVAIYEGNNMVTHTYNYGTPPKMHHSLDEVKSWYSAGIIGTGRPE